MRIVRIITNPEPTLYTVRFSGEEYDELDKNFEHWNNPEYLKSFFKDHVGDLRSYSLFHDKEYSINDAVRKTIRDAERLENLMLDLAEAGNEDDAEVLQTFFRQLNDMETNLQSVQKSKGKLKYQSWLRVYAIRIDEHLYVLTGGAIKLTKTMKERKHTQLELDKMKQVITFLERRGLVDRDEFKRMELGI